MPQEIPSILQKIVSRKNEEVEELYKSNKNFEYASQAKDMPPTFCFYDAITYPNNNGLNLIAELKLASPSKGDIRPGADPVEIARLYEDSGACAASVLTDRGFKGKLSYIPRIRKEVQIPLLRKDFIIDEAQIPESRVYGADAILLISAILEENQMEDYMGIAKEYGMHCLVESHNESELEKAINAGAEIFGINNRDLNTFTTDLNTTKKLAELVPRGYPIVTESGIHTREDVNSLCIPNVVAMLVGESLMSAEKNPTEEDMKNKIHELLTP